MVSFANILVGVDLSHGDRLVSEELSDHCENAVNRAIKLASSSGGELTFIAVIDISEQAMHLIEMHKSPEVSPVRDDASRVLQGLVDRAAEHGVKASFEIELGPSADGIIKDVLRKDRTLLIIGAKASPRLSQVLFGRTAVKLLRKCPCPVLVVKPGPDPILDNVLAADDFSDVAESVLDAAVKVAQLCDARLHVLHVEENVNDAKLASTGVPAEDLAKFREQQVTDARAKQADRLSRTDFRTLTQGSVTYIEMGPPVSVITEKLEEHQIDLLVMGTVGRSGLSALMMGNTAERLLNAVNCSLLAIKPEDFVCPVKA
ncbi:MAG: universal stress protein [Rubinisphaera brasiliensis]|uniref:UspA domain-containing protein n=1 Tax=Rubinisphaera brasiliensis (strain ATCC 49424 / DSM 5305 / JCM 21570 / IAM 15109 / NBRC 103401 / IFAM 1448) TaxID=756272 RepID=F0SJD9_RUBBR|nr:universal stress protein [Rubinisphaera brasiliensis]ADY59714.1 UspA domain-containing protein [Rubinisphaera brasiliensis DSM 5305]MBB01622.1 hypothetical protein [Planctomyces sp.]MBR9802653.1 universal stress protein [bacterium]